MFIKLILRIFCFIELCLNCHRMFDFSLKWGFPILTGSSSPSFLIQIRFACVFFSKIHSSVWFFVVWMPFTIHNSVLKFFRTHLRINKMFMNSTCHVKFLYAICKITWYKQPLCRFAKSTRLLSSIIWKFSQIKFGNIAYSFKRLVPFETDNVSPYIKTKLHRSFRSPTQETENGIAVSLGVLTMLTSITYKLIVLSIRIIALWMNA